jgi:hypothetical protein
VNGYAKEDGMMKKSASQSLDVHRTSATIAYVEDLLSPDDRSSFEEHLAGCTECSGDFQAVQMLVTRLKTHRGAFCPEPWELYQFYDTGEAPFRSISDHVEHCALCQEEVAALGKDCSETPLPTAVEQAFRRNVASTPQPERDAEPAGVAVHSERDNASESRWRRSAVGFVSRLSIGLASWARVPVLALGTAAVVALVMLLLPRGEQEASIAFSTVNWEATSLQTTPHQEPRLMGVPKRMLAEPANPGTVSGSPSADSIRPRLAIVLLFKGLPEPLPPNLIDSLYRAVEPTSDLAQHYEFVSPSDVTKALRTAGESKATARRLSDTLRNDLGVSVLLTLTVAPIDGKLTLEGLERNTATGEVLRQIKIDHLTEGQLESRLKPAVLALLSARR